MKNPNFAKAWTEEELAIVQEMFATATVAEMMQALPRHPWTGIRAKGKRLGLHREVITKRLPFSRGDGVCTQCHQKAKIVNSQYVSGLCDPCYRVAYARIKYERRRSEEKRPPVQFYWMGGTGAATHAESTDRSLTEMIDAATQRASHKMMPEIADLCKTERRILQQLDALRQHQQELCHAE